MNSNYANEFRPKLSKHELILERYKVILSRDENKNSDCVVDTNKSVTMNNSSDKSDKNDKNNLYKEFMINQNPNNNYDNRKALDFGIAIKTGNSSISNISNNNNSPLSSISFSNKEYKEYKEYLDLDKIKSKYMHIKSSNSDSNNIGNIANRNIKIMSNTTNADMNTNSNMNLCNQTIPNYEIEMIKNKYMTAGSKNNSHAQTFTTGNYTNPSPTSNISNIENTLLKYKQTKNENLNFGNKTSEIENKENMSNIKVENGQPKFLTQPDLPNMNMNKSEKNNLTNSNTQLNDKLSLLEQKMLMLQSITNEKSNSVNKDQLMNKIRAIVEHTGTSNNSNNFISESCYSETDLDNIQSIENNISNVKKMKKINNSKYCRKNVHLSNENNFGCNNTNTNDILNNLIENITGNLFYKPPTKDKDKSSLIDKLSLNNISNHNSINNSIVNEEDSIPNSNEIIIMPKSKTKIFKLRTSSAPPKKLTSFDEFLKKELQQ